MNRINAEVEGGGTREEEHGEEGRTRGQSRIEEMEGYFKFIDSASFADDRREALAFIQEQIEKDSGDAAISAGLLSNHRVKVRKEMLDLLLGRVAEGDRQGRVGDAMVKKWMLASNVQRSFMFMKKDALVQLAASLFQIRLNTTSSFDALIARMDSEYTSSLDDPTGNAYQEGEGMPGQESRTGTGRQTRADEITIRQEIIKAVLERSFMKPLKGPSREYCQMGHKLELPIGSDWMRDVNEKNLLPGFKVISLHTVGLVAKVDRLWAKDSIDFLAFVVNEAKEVQLWGVEIKSRQTFATITKEKEVIRQLKRAKYEMIDEGRASRYVHKSDERFQLLHHAYVYGLSRIALIVGNNSGKVISGTIVNYSNDGLEKYGTVVDKLKDLTLAWAYDTPASGLIIPPDVIAASKQVPAINGTEALYGTVKLWQAMFSDITILPYPVLKRIIPATHAQWNITKGGSDTITKIVDECFLNPPKQHTNFESVAVSRCISNLLATVLKLLHVTTAKDDLVSSYSTLQHYRNASSKRATFKSMLRRVYKLMKAEAEKLQSVESARRQTEAENASTPVRTKARRKKFNNQIPDPMDFAPARSTVTPMKARKRIIERADAHKHVLERMEKCNGFPFEIICTEESTAGKKKDPRQRCHQCGTKTAWKCIQCRLFFCMGYKKTKNREEQLYYHEVTTPQNQKITQIYGKSCFHVAHENGIRAALCQPCDEE